LNIHEYQAKEILESFGVSLPPFRVISSLAELEPAREALALEEAVIKVQVHAGGRGKAGGVKLARSKEEMKKYAQELLGMKIVNNQTGAAGVIAEKVLISPLLNYIKEYYVSILVDREKAAIVLIVSPEGGVDIEEVAKKAPEKILKMVIDSSGRIPAYKLIKVAKFMGWKNHTATEGMALIQNLANAFVACDASLVEINPLVEMEDGHIIALDAKLSVDENALFRQKKIASFYDPTQLSPLEARAQKFDLAYVALEGEIGCMVNGAGLAMATMDIIHYYGGTPANFLDVGGSATQEKVAEGFKIILTDQNVKAILVNIFGGIMNCVTLAAGIITAASELEIRVPLVVRMEGTNVEQGKKMLIDSGLNIIIAENLKQAAIKAVEAAKR
jgi:succinyl-CoA synthetase beta subunit